MRLVFWFLWLLVFVILSSTQRGLLTFYFVFFVLIVHRIRNLCWFLGLNNELTKVGFEPTTSRLTWRRQMQLCPPCNIARSGHFCICNRVRGYAKTVRRTCTWLYICARVSERACTEPIIIYSMNMHVLYDCSEYPTAEHFPCHSWHALSL